MSAPLPPFDPFPNRGAKREHPYLVVDVFTTEALAGNQLAVFLDGAAFSSEEMQRLAKEMNLAETVFLLPPEVGGDVRVRIFTPASELPFAGHPVLGTAFVVADALQKESVELETGAGVIPVELELDGRVSAFGWMSQPIPRWETYGEPERLLGALGVERSELPIELYPNGPRHIFVALASEEEVAALKPDLAALAEIAGSAANCFAGSGTTWKTRMFAPALGVPEDPASGSAAGPLAVHLARHGRISFGDTIEVVQGVEILRRSVLYARVDGSAERIERVSVGGSAVIVASGFFVL